MRILLLSQFFPPDAAPTGRLLADVAQRLATLGHDVTVITGRGAYRGRTDRRAPLTVRVLHVPSFPFSRSVSLRIFSYVSFLSGARERRIWLKKDFYRVPLPYPVLFFYNCVFQGAWRAGWVGYAWAHLRSELMRLREYKLREMALRGTVPRGMCYGPGEPNPRVRQYE